MPRGGARTGAGRPKTERQTKTIRVSKTLPDIAIIEDMIEILKLAKEEAKTGQGPRWDRIKRLINELESTGIEL